jgi:hypothetical protein
MSVLLRFFALPGADGGLVGVSTPAPGSGPGDSGPGGGGDVGEGTSVGTCVVGAIGAPHWLQIIAPAG